MNFYVQVALTTSRRNEPLHEETVFVAEPFLYGSGAVNTTGITAASGIKVQNEYRRRSDR